MNLISFDNEPKELIDAQTHVWNHIYSYHNSMALRCAIQLGIPDAIQKHGKPMTCTELANSLSIHPNKAHSLPRLMRLFVHSNFFSSRILSTGEEVFDLTINSQLLLKDHPITLAPYAMMFTDPILINPSYNLSSWFQNEEETPFNIAHKGSIWELAQYEPQFNMLFNESMASDARFVVSLLGNNSEFRGIFEGIKSLVDVGGGDGTMAIALAKAFPGLNCTVFDLPHVVEGFKEECEWNLQYVAGDMFEAISSAQVVLLKLIMHDWSDEDCVKILQRCKGVIPNKHQGGKIIIIDMVMEIYKEITNYSYSQILFDIQMMNLTPGKERNEEEWKSLFTKAGYNEYKIFSILGSRSIIEVYPS